MSYTALMEISNIIHADTVYGELQYFRWRALHAWIQQALKSCRISWNDRAGEETGATNQGPKYTHTPFHLIFVMTVSVMLTEYTGDKLLSSAGIDMMIWPVVSTARSEATDDLRLTITCKLITLSTGPHIT